MAERPILFSGPMVRAILDGSKTQTRRIVKACIVEGPSSHMCIGAGETAWPIGPAKWLVSGTEPPPEFVRCCPYGRPGDRLWVRETFALIWPGEAPPEDVRDCRAEYRADGDEDRFPGEWPPESKGDPGRPRWRPSIHMPRWASRIDLEITSVRVERLHDISDADILAEGVTREALESMWPATRDVLPADVSPRELWRLGWTDINGAESWNANPWVWVVGFKRVVS